MPERAVDLSTEPYDHSSASLSSLAEFAVFTLTLSCLRGVLEVDGWTGFGRDRNVATRDASKSPHSTIVSAQRRPIPPVRFPILMTCTDLSSVSDPLCQPTWSPDSWTSPNPALGHDICPFGNISCVRCCAVVCIGELTQVNDISLIATLLQGTDDCTMQCASHLHMAAHLQ